MGVPKKRTSRARRDKRRAHHALVPVNAIVCPTCGEPMMRHRACGNCGHYRGRSLVGFVKEGED